MLRLLVLLPCLLLVSGQRDGCRRLQRCQNKITESSIFEETEDLLSFSDDAAILDSVCGEMRTYSRCIERRQDGCQDALVINEANAMKDVIEYMCSERGRALILRLSESECANSPTIENHFDIMMQGCLETFTLNVQMEALEYAFNGEQPELSAFCPFVDSLRDCLVDGSESLCGADMRDFIGDIWDIASRNQFAEFGCTSAVQSKRSTVKRAIPMILKRAAQLKKLRK